MLTFNTLLAASGIDPRTVRLLRHQTGKAGRTPFQLWRDSPADFELYQSTQDRDHRSYFASPRWASFVGTPDGGTLFVGLYDVELAGSAPDEFIDPLTNQPPGFAKGNVGGYDLYRQKRNPVLDSYVGRLWIDWSKGGERSWRQRADSPKSGDKPVLKLTETFEEPEYPGHSRFISSLSQLDRLPAAWLAVLKATRGIYLLTCPRTKEQYVGQADGDGGFLGRWRQYAITGHGGNIALKGRDPSDYQVSILEVAGSDEALGTLESLWKAKLQSREMGLNRN